MTSCEAHRVGLIGFRAWGLGFIGLMGFGVSRADRV